MAAEGAAPAPLAAAANNKEAAIAEGKLVQQLAVDESQPAIMHGLMAGASSVAGGVPAEIPSSNVAPPAPPGMQARSHHNFSQGAPRCYPRSTARSSGEADWLREKAPAGGATGSCGARVNDTRLTTWPRRADASQASHYYGGGAASASGADRSAPLDSAPGTNRGQ